VKEARLTTDLMTNGIVQPALSDELLAGDSQSVAAFDRLVRDRVLSGRIIRVKLWRSDGVIAYSDEPRLIGQKFTLAEDEQEILRDGGSAASVSDLTAPENIYEQPDKALLEVYERVTTPGGQPALMEAYLPYDSVAASAESTWRSFLPALVVGLVALELLQFPLAWRLASQIARSNGERLRLLERAADAAEIERKHIAADLHDTVVQDLAAQRFGLLATAASLPAGDETEAADALRAAAEQVGGSVRRLREVLTELHSPNVRPGELSQALEDLAAQLEEPGLHVTLDIARLPKLTPAQETAVFRVARESLRNVRKHSGARNVRVSLVGERGLLVLRVADDGAGFDPEPPAQRPQQGHLGMELLRSAAREANGTVSITSAPGAGTTVKLEVPL
jgi:signal transduction histidine kinase